MATIYVTDSGYINRYGSYNGSDSDAYVGTPSYSLVGMYKFGSSVNAMLGTTATSWSQLRFTKALLRVKVRDAVTRTGYTVGITTGNPGLNVNSATVAGKVTNLTWGGGGRAGSQGDFDLVNLFNSLTSTTFTPDTSGWWIFIKNTGCKGANRRFERKSRFRTYLTLEGGWSSSIHYFDGNDWIQSTPYYFDGTNWIQCSVYYFDGTNWIQI